MRGVAILLTFNLAGMLLQSMLHIPLPGNVIGLILFTVCLFIGIVKLHWVESAATFLLRHMLLFFAPAIVSTIAFFGLIRHEWVSMTVGMVGSTIVVMLVTGWTAQALGRRVRE